MDILSYLSAHKRELLEIALAAHATATLVVNLTPSPKDNEALGSLGRFAVKAYRGIELMAGIWTPLAKR